MFVFIRGDAKVFDARNEGIRGRIKNLSPFGWDFLFFFVVFRANACHVTGFQIKAIMKIFINQYESTNKYRNKINHSKIKLCFHHTYVKKFDDAKDREK